MRNKRKVAAVMGDGRIGLVEEAVPELRPGTVLIEVKNSLISPGTEFGGGWRALKRKAENSEPDAKPRKFGYSNAGIVLKAGEGVQGFKPGDRVAAIGSGYALHTDYAVVPQNLCCSLPENLSFAQGSYAMLAATALHALRRGKPELGEYAAIVGLGLVGQLAAMLYRLAGNYVIGWDRIGRRVDIAKGWGIGGAVLVGKEDPVSATAKFTGGRGIDTAVLAIAGDANAAYEDVEKCFPVSPDTHPVGRIVIVGGVQFQYKSTLTNIDIRHASRTGPGYHDEAWERGGNYPPVFVRWTSRDNVALCLRLMSESKLDVDCLTTHTIPLAGAEDGIRDALKDPDEILGVVFSM